MWESVICDVKCLQPQCAVQGIHNATLREQWILTRVDVKDSLMNLITKASNLWTHAKHFRCIEFPLWILPAIARFSQALVSR